MNLEVKKRGHVSRQHKPTCEKQGEHARLSYDQVFIVKLFIMLARGEWSFRCTCHMGARAVLEDKQKVKLVFRACSILKWQCSFPTLEKRWLVPTAALPVL